MLLRKLVLCTVRVEGKFNKQQCIVRRCTNRQPPAKAHDFLPNSSPDCRSPAYGDLSLQLGWTILLFNTPSYHREQGVDHSSAHTGPGAPFPYWTCYLVQALAAGSCQPSSLATGCILCPQVCKHRETHGKHFHQQEPKTQCPARPATTPHIQRPQNHPHPGTAVPAWWQVAGNDSEARPVTFLPQGFLRSEAVPESPISTPKMLENAGG